MRWPPLLLLLVLAGCRRPVAHDTRPGSTPNATPRQVETGGKVAGEICTPCIHADMEFLAGDTLEGRGSATRNEHLAALYAVSLLESFGVEPAGSDGYLQRAPLPPQLPAGVEERWHAAGLDRDDRNRRSDTWNVLALLRGSDPLAAEDVIVLSAHLDHLGVGNPVNGDAIYNGADDDASGVTAVLELARALSRGPRPKRSILFALFGSEELGSIGSRYFLDHPTLPLSRIITDLELEMIGRRDPGIAAGKLWLSGYERSDLGPALAQHGAPLVADPRPKEHFFERSDNYPFARSGIVAQTISSFGLHADYHQPGDDLAHIDFVFLTGSIRSVLAPIRWMANSSWRPKWNRGGQP